MPRSKAKGAKATWRGLRTAVPWCCELQEPNANKCSKQVQSVCLSPFTTVLGHWLRRCDADDLGSFMMISLSA